MVKYYTHQNPPVLPGEVSSNPSETRQSDTMDIQETIARFFRQGGVIPQQLDATSLTAEEKEAMFDAVSEDEIMDADLSEQKSFVDEVSGTLSKQANEKDIAEKKETPKTEEKKEATDSPKGE